MDISVVIPAFNEASNIRNTINKVRSYLVNKGLTYEIIVVDDGSRDNTINILESLDYPELKILGNGRNYGKGYSVKHGMLNANGDAVLFTDADLSTPIEEIDKFLPGLSSYDVVVGSRRMQDSDIRIKQPFYRIFLGRTFSLLVSKISKSKIKDTQCGFKIFRNPVAKEIFKRQKLNGFAFDVEILFIASLLNYKVKELPVKWFNNKKSKVNPIIDPLKMLKDILKVRWNYIKGKYN